jgi:hypothetical protein
MEAAAVEWASASEWALALAPELVRALASERAWAPVSERALEPELAPELVRASGPVPAPGRAQVEAWKRALPRRRHKQQVT